MARDTRLVVTIYDNYGSPLPGLTPVWTFCSNFDLEISVTPTPEIEDIGHGVYLVERKSPGHIVGQLDFGSTAYPRYVTYNVMPSVPVSSFTSSGSSANPVIAVLAAPRLNQIAVTFSVAVQMTTDITGALCLTNYEVAPLTVLSIREMSDHQVMLTTSTQLPTTTYNLVVYNVQDLYGNPISPL